MFIQKYLPVRYNYRFFLVFAFFVLIFINNKIILVLLGVTFDAASQCHLQFGAEAVVCAKPTELCEHLWCLVNNTCKTMLRPAAPGTTCGENMVRHDFSTLF